MTSNPTSSATPESQPDTKPWACVSCAQRKIKCDRLLPVCTQCSSKDRECEYKAPAPPNRKKRKPGESLEQRMLSRITEYEKTLVNLQVPFESFVVSERRLSSELDNSGLGKDLEREINARAEETSENGQLWDTGADSQRYYSHGLLVKLAEEFKQGLRIDPEAMSDTLTRTDDSMSPPSMDGSAPGTGADLSQPSYPFKQQAIPESLLVTLVSKLWPIFVENVHPVTMILHAPSLRSLIDKVTVRSIPITKTIESLFSAICACAVASLTDEDCDTIFSTDRSLLLHQFRSMAQQRLREAGFYEFPSLASLQAYSLLMLSLQGEVSSHTFSTLTAIAIRSATALGIHRGTGKPSSPPFQAELHRRLWWFIVCTDSRAVEMSGLASQCLPSFDATLPLNLNDSDIGAGMRMWPVARSGATEMMYVLVRYEVLRVQIRCARAHQVGMPLTPGDVKFDTEIDRLEGRLEGHYLRFCDPVVPLHTLATSTSRLWLNKLRLLWTSHLREELALDAPEVPRMMRIVEYDNLVMTQRQTSRFVWHVRNQFPWGALLQLLDVLCRAYPLAADRSRATASVADRAWALAAECMAAHPELIDLDPGKAAHCPRQMQLGLAYTAVRAWEARAAATGEPVAAAPTCLHEPLRQRAAGRPIIFDPACQHEPPAQRSAASIPVAFDSTSPGSSLSPAGTDPNIPGQQPQPQPQPRPPQPQAGPPSAPASGTSPSSPSDGGASAELNSMLNAPDAGFAASYADLWFDASSWSAFAVQPGMVGGGAVPVAPQPQPGAGPAGMDVDFLSVGMPRSNATAATGLGWDGFNAGGDTFDFGFDDIPA